MSPLDNRAIIKQLDTDNYLSHILDASEQLVDGFELGESIIIPALYAQAKQIVLLATGEMMPVALALQSLTVESARVPVIIIHDYVLPHWVSSDTLVIALDYYGTTEQVLVAFREAASRRARMLAVSVGGDLSREARRVRAVHVPLSYGAPARAAFFYAFSCVAYLFRKLDLCELRESTVTESSVLVRSLLESIGPEVAQYQNNAKQLAEKILSRKTIVVGSGPLISIAKRWQMAVAQNSKTVITSSTLSEFNDTIINGLGYFSKPIDAPFVIMLQSKYDHPRNKLQQTLTYQVAQAQKIVYEQIFMHPSGSLFGEIALAALLGEMTSFYVALLSHHNPSQLDATDYIRGRLKEEKLFD